MRSDIASVFTRYVALAARRPLLLLLALGLLWAVCLVLALRLQLHTDLAELLPDNHPGVLALRRISGRQISSTNLVLLIESPDRDRNRRFAEALRPGLARLIPSVLSEIEWRPNTEVPEYARRWQWLYAERDDLLTAELLLDRLVAQRKSPLLVDLEGDAEQELRSLRARLDKALPPLDEAPYFEAKDKAVANPDRWYLGVMLWRRGGGLAAPGDQETLDAVRQIVERTRPAAFHPQMKVEYSGHIAMAIDEHNAVRDDLTLATSVCVSLVLLAIYLYFRRAAVLLAVGAPAVLGLFMSLALARFTIHYLNANTAFLISIILGNGINAPIILLARYGEERRRGAPVQEALAQAMAATLLATGAAMAAASISYGCLLLTSLRGLNQFGLVGGAGMFFVWVMTFALVPPLVLFGERLRPGLMTPAESLWRGPFALIGRLAERSPGLLALAAGALLALSVLPAHRYVRDPLEYNFNNLRTRETDSQRRWSIMYDLGLGNVGAGYIARDGVILVDRPEQADPVAEALRKQDRDQGERHILETVRTLNSTLPAEQDEKLLILARIRAKIDRHRDLLEGEEWSAVQKWRPPEYLRRLGVPDLPRRLRDNFTEVDGTRGRLIGIDADWHRYVEGDGRELIRLSRAMQVTVAGRTWVAAAASTVFAGMLETIVRDAPRVTAAALVGVLALVLCAFGLRGGLPVMATLLVGLCWLIGLLGMLKLKLNFLNFVALPITLGVGVDYAANLWARLRREGLSRLGPIIADTGSAVALCSTTTIIGYSSLLLAHSRALQSFGMIADLGEVACLVSALLMLPALVWLMRGKQD